MGERYEHFIVSSLGILNAVVSDIRQGGSSRARPDLCPGIGVSVEQSGHQAHCGPCRVGISGGADW